MIRRAVILISLSFVALLQCLNAQTTAFNYQGRLTDSGNPANGAFQMQFKLFDSLGGAGQVGSTITNVPVTVTQGAFAVKLDFGSNALSGANRWLEIAVRRNSGESYVTLAPREQIASSPYAVQTLNAQMLGGVPASEYVTNATVGSSFIRNGATLQTGNFNISGNGFFGGNVGIRTTTPGFPLDVAGPVRAFGTTSNDMWVQTLGGANAWARFTMQTPSQIWGIGTSNNFNGNQFYLFDTTNQQRRMTVQPGGGAISFPLGNIGIGTESPGSHLEVRGSGLGAQQRITDSVSGSSLVFQSGAGADMKVTGFNFNSGQPVPLNLSVDGANLGIGGHVVQARDKGGTVKAIVSVNETGTILRCYNGITGSSSGNCGFTAARLSEGVYDINFGFQVDDRFINVLNRTVFGCGSGLSELQSLSGNLARLTTFCPAGTPTNKPFMIFVF